MSWNGEQFITNLRQRAEYLRDRILEAEDAACADPRKVEVLKIRLEAVMEILDAAEDSYDAG